MGSEHQQYAVDDEIAVFFSKTPVTRETCDSLAKDLVGGDQVVPVAIQGACSYTVYAGQDLDYVVQFRLKSLGLKAETAALARRIFGTFGAGDILQAVARRELRSRWSRALACLRHDAHPGNEPP